MACLRLRADPETSDSTRPRAVRAEWTPGGGADSPAVMVSRFGPGSKATVTRLFIKIDLLKPALVGKVRLALAAAAARVYSRDTTPINDTAQYRSGESL